MRFVKALRYCAGSLALARFALAHGQHSQAPVVEEDADWATRHMASKWAPYWICLRVVNAIIMLT